MPEFRVIDLRANTIVPEIKVEAKSPEEAAEKALGVMLVRSGLPKTLACRVYWTEGGQTNMVRLYGQPANHR